MLRALAIRDFTIIDSLELEFEPGFTAITGETGAGKSILIDALGLLLGDRADTGLVRSGCEQAELSARFDLSANQEATGWLDEQLMAEDGELLIRRVVPTQGSSRAWINGRSATISQLAEIGDMLVEIHGQHDHQQLNKPGTQRRLLDQHVDDQLLVRVAEAHRAWQQARDQLAAFEAESGDPEQIELLRFQCHELEDLALGQDEYARLENEQERMARGDEVMSCVARATNSLDQDDGPSVRSLLLEASHAIDRIRNLDDELESIATLLEETRINIDEALGDLEKFSSEDSRDPERLDQVNRRLERVLDLARKHRVKPEELPDIAISLRRKLDRLDNHDEQRRELVSELESCRQAWTRSADELTRARMQAASTLGQAVSDRLSELGMERAQLSFTVNPEESPLPAASGRDHIEIEFSANPGQPTKPLRKTASGGELSRVSLALMIAARPSRGPLVRVFDEVDAGIGGETAHVVGRFLRQVATGGQAFCVTHLAQVAAGADHQMRVEKTSQGSKTGVGVTRLSAAERPIEIARMLGNAESSKSREHAREMLKKARTTS
jgi:DNA repair protein RecN (Recombination protein N)